jgi:hypothetical protein
VFVSDESSQPEVYVQPFPGPGARVQISTDGGGNPQWGPDGRELFYRSQGHFVSVPIQSGPGGTKAGTPVQLFELPGGAGNIEPSPDGQRFLANVVTDTAALVTILVNWSGARMQE